MADRLPTAKVTEYNGYKFPTDDIETTLYRVTPIYDEAKRAVTFCEFTLGLKWVLKHDEATDGQVQELVRKLTVPAGELLYEGRGLAFPQVNRSKVKDVSWGPKPGPVTLRPVGAGRATEAEWQVTWRAPVCADAAFSGIAEWNFGVSYLIDADGVTTRTTRGHVTIAVTRTFAQDRKVPRSADSYRVNVVPQLLPGFKREAQSYDLSLDKSTLNYEVVDREIGGNTPGPGLLSAEASETVANTNPKNFFMWTRTLRGSYTVAPGYSVSVAWNRFWDTFKDRLAEIRRQIGQPVFVPWAFSAEDPNLYGSRQKVNMSFTFIVSKVTIRQAMESLGMWRPVPGSSWRAWTTNLNNNPSGNPLGVRGSANLMFNVGDDALIDLCRGDKPPAGSSQGTSNTTTTDLRSQLSELEKILPVPTQESSWLHYEVFFRVVLDTGAVVVKTLPEKPLKPAPAGTSSVWNVLGAGGLPLTSKTAIPAVVQQPANPNERRADTTIQHRTTPTAHVYLTGRAARYGFDIPHPQLVSVGGLPATLVTTGDPSEGFSSGVVKNAVYPVYRAEWNLHYVVPGLADYSGPPNELLDTEMRGGKSSLGSAVLRGG